MQVILLERVAKLGQMGDVVDVKPGYARNFLLPQRKAQTASEAETPQNVSNWGPGARRAPHEVISAKTLAKSCGGRASAARISNGDIAITVRGRTSATPSGTRPRSGARRASMG